MSDPRSSPIREGPKRREKLFSTVESHLAKKRSRVKHFALVLFLFAEFASARPSPALRLEANADAMGTAFSVVLYGPDRNRLEAAAADALAEARRLDALLSNYKPESEWSRVNREAADHPVPVSDELFDLLTACMNYSDKSEGAFDISVGPLMKVWGFYKGSGRLPAEPAVREAMAAVGYRNIVLDRTKRTVFFARAGVNLDPGGVGKGYAVDRMAAVLRKAGIGSALISGGGSSIYCLGAPPDEPGWKIAIQDPGREAGKSDEVVLRDESVSTSGSYEKFFTAEGKTWSHIMDPRTGYPARGAVSVSVVAPLTLDSEVWAKPYYVLGRDWTASHKPANFRVFYCRDKADAEAGYASGPDKADQQCAWLQ